MLRILANFLKPLILYIYFFILLKEVTCVDHVPVLCRTGAFLSLSTDAHPVALPAAQRTDVTGGPIGGAGPLLCDG